MPSRRKTPKKKPTRKSNAGRPPIFSDEQKRLLGRMIRTALKEQLRSVVRSI